MSYSHLSPKLGATYEAAPELNLFVSWRNGFRAPSQSQIFRQGSAENTVGLHPVLVNSYETGVRGRIAHSGREWMDAAIPLLVGRHIPPRRAASPSYTSCFHFFAGLRTGSSSSPASAAQKRSRCRSST